MEAPAQETQLSVGDSLKGSDRRVLLIAVTGWLSSLPPIRRAKRPFWLAAAVLGLVPLLACVAEHFRGEGVGWFVWMIATVYGLLIALMIVGARYSWTSLIRLGPDIDAVLAGADRATFLAWLERALGSVPQILAFLFGVVFSTWVGIQLNEPLSPRYVDEAGIAYSVTVAWTGGVGAVTVYWLWGAPVLFYPLARVEQPRLDWIAPLQTPLVQNASRLVIYSSRIAAVGLLLFTIPIAITLGIASRQLSVWLLGIAPLILSLATLFACSVLPQIALEDLVRRGKSHILATVRPFLPSPGEVFAQPQPELLRSTELYERIAVSPVSVVDWKRLVEYLLLLLSAIGPIVIALLSS